MNEQKKCTQCHQTKLISAFSPGKRYCKACRNAYQKEWAAKVGYHKKGYRKPGLRRPPSEFIGKTFKELTVISHLGMRSREDGSSGRHAWYQCQCSCGKIVEVLGTSLTNGNTGTCGCRLLRKKEKNHSWKGCGDIWGSHWSSIRYHANQRGIPFEITIEQAWKLFQDQKGLCRLTGMPISFNKVIHGSKTASLDRIDSTKSYTVDNVQWIHKDVNHMKQEFDQQKFIELCRLIVNYQPTSS